MSRLRGLPFNELKLCPGQAQGQILTATSLSSLPRSHIPTFPLALRSLEGQQERQGLAHAQQTRRVTSRYPLRAGLLLVFVGLPLQGPEILRKGFGIWVSRWASQSNFFGTYWVVRSGNFRPYDTTTTKDTECVPSSPITLSSSWSRTLLETSPGPQHFGLVLCEKQ